MKKPDCAFVMRLDQFLRCKPFVSNSRDSRPYLCGVRIEKGKTGAICVATDGHRLGVLDCPDALSVSDGTWSIPKELKLRPKKENQPWVIGKGKSLSIVEFETKRDKDKNLIADDPELALSRIDDCTVRYSNCLIDGKYPDWRRVIPKLDENAMKRTFNGEYLKTFGNYLNISGNTADDAHIVIDNNDPRFMGVLMPMRGDFKMPDWFSATAL